MRALIKYPTGYQQTVSASTGRWALARIVAAISNVRTAIVEGVPSPSDSYQKAMEVLLISDWSASNKQKWINGEYMM